MMKGQRDREGKRERDEGSISDMLCIFAMHR